MAHKNEEISAEEAAILLDLHPRTIRNLIQRRELKALKVKGRWYLDKASVMALKDNGVPLSEPHERAVTTQSLSLRGPHRLAAYRLCLHGYSLLPDLDLLDTETRKRCQHLQLQVLEHLGAGFYSYGMEKEFSYVRSRASLGSLLAILFSSQKSEFDRANDFLESECIRAISSLIRKMQFPKGKKTHESAAPLQ